MEVQELLKALVETMPGLHADPDRADVFSSSPGFRGLDHFWVRR